MFPIGQILCGDCVEILSQFPDNCIDLTITSPPYDNLRRYEGYSFDFKPIVNSLLRIMKVGGVVVWVVGDATINYSETGSSFKQVLYFMDTGFILYDTMIYKNSTPPPRFGNRYTQSFQYMFVVSKGVPKTVNLITEPCKHANKSWKAYPKLDGDSYWNKSYVTKSSKPIINVWEYDAKNSNKVNHPAPFPLKLAEDHIISWSNPGDIILDPMCGSGTTCKMAKKNDRRFIGIDVSRKYCDEAEQLLKNQNCRN